MPYQIEELIVGLIEWLKNFYHSPWMLTFKILAGIYVAIIFVDIILMLILRGVGSNIRTGLRGMDIPLATPSKMQKRWVKVEKRLRSKNPSQYKVAVIEADLIADEILKGIGYEGDNMSERLSSLAPHQLDNLEDLKNAHEIRNRIVHEADFLLDENQAKEVVAVYEHLLKHLEFL